MATDRSPSPSSVILKATRLHLEFLNSNRILRVPNSATATAPISQRWVLPSPNSFKINTDASWQRDSLQCGLAAIVRNSSGHLVDGLSIHSLAQSPLVAALALTLVCQLCSKLPAPVLIHVESDSLPLIQAISSPQILVDWSAQPLVDGLRLFAQANPNVTKC